ncbi:MAG: DUF5685 family protein [Clostridiales bacterium]|nr:DUF5685 family protein [Clostridiales bacterium]
MFGYIAPALRSLPEDRQERYRSFYCGVCHSLKSRFGQAGRVSLSNDMTFLAMLLSSLYEPEGAVTASRCALHPVRPHAVFHSEYIDYAADMNVLLFYYKCRDQKMDDRSAAGAAGEKAFRKKAAQVAERFPDQAAGVRQALDELWEMEKSPDAGADALCALSGRMLASVFVPKPNDVWASSLYAVGEGLGRFVYWMDAWEDLEADRKKGRFNPLEAYASREDYDDFVRATLEMMIADAAQAFELLPLEKDLDILRNVIYSGVWQRYILKLNKNAGKQEERKEETGHDE